jgi:hypothetical protein
MSDLRSKAIRLAHSKPELRGELLPLLKVAATREELIDKIRTQAEAIVEICDDDKAKGNMRVEIKTSDVFQPHLKFLADAIGALDRKIG